MDAVTNKHASDVIITNRWYSLSFSVYVMIGLRLIVLENRVLLNEARGTLVCLKSVTAYPLSNNHDSFTNIWHRLDLCLLKTIAFPWSLLQNICFHSQNYCIRLTNFTLSLKIFIFSHIVCCSPNKLCILSQYICAIHLKLLSSPNKHIEASV